MIPRLTLYEELLLIALDDEKGTTGFDDMSSLALGGAVLAELVADGALVVTGDKKKKVGPAPAARVDDPILAEAFSLVRESKKAHDPGHWVRKFAGMKDLKHRAARGLVGKQILREETGKVLFVFNRTIYPERDGRPERRLVARLEEAIFSDRRDLDERTVIVVSLAHATGLLPRVIAKKRLKARKDRLKAITNGDVVGKATKEAVEAVQAAIFVAAILPAITATTVTSS